MQVRINKPFDGYKAGQMVRVEVDADGCPLRAEWRRRLADAKEDQCCEVVDAQSVDQVINAPERAPKRRDK